MQTFQSLATHEVTCIFCKGELGGAVALAERLRQDIFSAGQIQSEGLWGLAFAQGYEALPATGQQVVGTLMRWESELWTWRKKVKVTEKQSIQGKKHLLPLAIHGCDGWGFNDAVDCKQRQIETSSPSLFDVL